MSHFAMLIITEEKPTKEELSEVLAPFHEFESTGDYNEYVQNINITEEARKKFEKDTERKYKDLSGNFHNPYDNEFYREPTFEEKEKYNLWDMRFNGNDNGISWDSRHWGDGKGYRAKIHFIPEGWEDVEIPSKEVMSFAQWAVDYYDYSTFRKESLLKSKYQEKITYGWIEVDENNEVVEIINRTNPNAKWDWWTVGGRWSGMLREKGTGNNLDSICIKDYDMEYVRNLAATEGAKEWDKVYSVVEDLNDFIPWQTVIKELYKKENRSEAREFYYNQRANKLIIEASKMEEFKKLIWVDLEDFMCSREEFIQKEILKATTFFGYIKDGQWYEKGEMGWWGIVSDEKDGNIWSEHFNEMLESLPDNSWITVVDCHI